ETDILKVVHPQRRGDVHEIAEQIVEHHVGVKEIAGQEQERYGKGVGDEGAEIETEFFLENTEEFHKLIDPLDDRAIGPLIHQLQDCSHLLRIQSFHDSITK